MKWLRADIDGIRAMAVILVISFHAGIKGFDGGFIGVDIFYVLSGYLITSNLLRDTFRTGRVRLFEFWARRIRRLAPALALVIVVTTLAAAVILSPLELETVAQSAGAASFYVSNFFFAGEATNYFAHDLSANPFLHTWSLGVEEQFYLIWPLIFIGAIALTRNRPRELRKVLAIGFTLTLVVSLTLSILLTNAGSPWAFYSLPSRAWEFALAGLFAMVTMPRRFGHRWWGAASSIVGLGLLAYATTTMTAQTPFPGIAALVPVLGTILMIAGGFHQEGETLPWQTRLLSWRPIRWIGSVSYSWYLWHTPFIVFAVVLTQSQSPVTRTIAALVSLGAAALTYHFFENKIRFSKRLQRSQIRTYTLGAVGVLAGASLAFGLAWSGQWRLTQEPVASVLAVAEQVPDHTCPETPSTASGVEYCLGGDLDATQTVMLVGDSHAGHWKNALIAAGEENGFRVAVRWLQNCPAIGVRVVNVSNVSDPACGGFQTDTLSVIDELDPAAVIVASASGYLPRVRGDDGGVLPVAEQIALWDNKFSGFAERMADSGHPMGVILDNPRLPYEPTICLTRLGGSDARCHATREIALGELEPIRDVEMSVTAELGTTTFDPTSVLCDDEWCSVRNEGVIVYSDRSHLSNDWTSLHTGDLVTLVDGIRASSAK